MRNFFLFLGLCCFLCSCGDENPGDASPDADMSWSNGAGGRDKVPITTISAMIGMGGGGPVECQLDKDCATLNDACSVSRCIGQHCIMQMRDDDGDGHGLCVSEDSGMYDCNDLNPDIHPGVEEVCGDERDDDCDGGIDEGCFEFCQPYLGEINAAKGWWRSCCEVNGTFKQPQTATPQPFELVKAEDSLVIFYTGSNSVLYELPLMSVFASWFGRQDAQGVPVMDASICGRIIEYPLEVVQQAQLGQRIIIKPASFLLRQENTSISWITAPGRYIRELGSGVAEGLFPAGSIPNRLLLLPDAYITDYSVGSPVNSPDDCDMEYYESRTLEQELGLAP